MRAEGASVHGCGTAGCHKPGGRSPEMVRHGETGFLATTDVEWVEAIRTLAGDPDLAERWERPAAGGRTTLQRGGRGGSWVNLIDGLTAGRATA